MNLVTTITVIFISKNNYTEYYSWKTPLFAVDFHHTVKNYWYWGHRSWQSCGMQSTASMTWVSIRTSHLIQNSIISHIWGIILLVCYGKTRLLLCVNLNLFDFGVFRVRYIYNGVLDMQTLVQTISRARFVFYWRKVGIVCLMNV